MPVTVLFLSANPSGTRRLDVDEEYRDIEEERLRARLRDAFELRSVPAARIDDVRLALADHRPTVVHFGGHGQHRAGPAAGEGDVRPIPGSGGAPDDRTELLLNDKTGHPAPVPIEALAELFRLSGGSVRCVVLNACYSLAQAKAIAQYVDCAIGTSNAIRDQAAIAFSTWFYGALFNGDTIENAFASGRNGVNLNWLDDSRLYQLCEREPGVSGKLRLAEPPKVPMRMPRARNPSFVDRDKELEQLHGVLQDPQPAGRRPVVLTGMAGIGKTQIAVEYAYKYEASYRHGVYFIDAGGGDWRPAIAKLAVSLDLKAENAPEAERQLRLVGALDDFLRARPEALVIFDFVEDLADLERDRAAGLIPANLGCRVLVTTRRRDAPFKYIDVPVLPEDAAVKLLLSQRSAREPVDDPATATIICRRFGAMPLTIALAAAFLGKNLELSLAEYVSRMTEYGLGSSDPPRVKVNVTLQSQWDALENADARLVLKTAALLDVATDIPQARLSLLTGFASAAAGGLPSPLFRALRDIRALSFVEPMRGRDAVRLEPQVWTFVKGKIDAPEVLAAACGERLGEALRDMPRLRKEVETRGIDEVLMDLRIGIELAGTTGQARLEALSRPLDRESSVLRKWDPAKAPGLLLQQLRNRCLDMGIREVRERAEAELAEHRWSWLRERFPFSRDSEALLRTLEGHTLNVTGVAMTSDGRTAVSASADRTLRVWDLGTGRVLRILRGHTQFVIGVAVTPDGRIAVSASLDLTLKVWDLETGRVLHTLRGHTDFVWGVAVTSDGRIAISASRDQTLKVWDVGTGQALRTLEGHTEGVEGVAMTPDGRIAVSASWDHTLMVWDVRTGQFLRTLEGHTDKVRGVAVTPDGGIAVSASEDRTLKVWDVKAGQVLRTLQGHTEWVLSVAVTPDGSIAVSGSADKTLKMWDVGTGQVLRTLQGHTSNVSGVAVTPDGRIAVSASGDYTLKVWNLRKEQVIRAFEGHTEGVEDVAVTPDGRIAVSASWDKTLKVWDPGKGRVLHTLQGHAAPVHGVAVTSDGRIAVSASRDKTVKMWDLGTGQVLRTLQGHTDFVYDVALTSDARTAISASADRTLKVWDLGTGQVLRTLVGHTGWVLGVAMTPDGRIAVSASEDGTLKVWDPATGQMLRTLEGHTGGVRSVAMTPDGRMAVSASWDKTLKVWDVGTGQLLRTLEGHTWWVFGVSVTSDGHSVISASWDDTLRVWDLVEPARPTMILDAHVFMCCCTTTADARTIVAGDSAGVLHVLDWITSSA